MVRSPSAEDRVHSICPQITAMGGRVLATICVFLSHLLPNLTPQVTLVRTSLTARIYLIFAAKSTLDSKGSAGIDWLLAKFLDESDY